MERDIVELAAELAVERERERERDGIYSLAHQGISLLSRMPPIVSLRPCNLPPPTLFVEHFSPIPVLQIFAMGTKYFRDEWNLMDGSIVVTSVTADVLGLLSVRGNALSSLRVLRALRALRPLRLIPRAPGLKRVVNAMIRGLPPVLNVAVVVLVFFLIFRWVNSCFNGTTLVRDAMQFYMVVMVLLCFLHPT